MSGQYFLLLSSHTLSTTEKAGLKSHKPGNSFSLTSGFAANGKFKHEALWAAYACVCVGRLGFMCLMTLIILGREGYCTKRLAKVKMFANVYMIFSLSL